jgi:hypothetical protein
MADKRDEFRPCGSIPHRGRAVETDGGEAIARWRPDYVHNRDCRMILRIKVEQFVAGGCVPYLDAAAPVAGGDGLARRRPRRALLVTRLAGQGEQDLAVRR